MKAPVQQSAVEVRGHHVPKAVTGMGLGDQSRARLTCTYSMLYSLSSTAPARRLAGSCSRYPAGAGVLLEFFLCLHNNPQ